MKAAAALLLLLLLLPLCCGVETYCDGRQKNTKCYGPLGGSVVIQLLNTSTEFKFEWYRNNQKIFEQQGDYIVNELEDRLVNGAETMTLHNLTGNDTDNYRLKIFGSDGIVKAEWILQLIIQAPVSDASLTPQCLSQGEMKVSCHSVGGDSPLYYSWSLKGVAHHSSDDDSSSITLQPGESGYVACDVSNNVSTASAGQMIPECDFINCTLTNGAHFSNWVPGGTDINCSQATTTSSTEAHLTVMATVLSVLLFLLVLAVAFVCVHKKRHKDQGSTQVEDAHELTYADVNILKRDRQVPQTTPQEVEYGQVNISKRPWQIATRKEAESVYAAVRR